MAQGLPRGGQTRPGTARRLASDYYVVCTRFATVPLFLPVIHGTELTLIDAGIADTPAIAIEPVLRQEGDSITDVQKLLLTHGHHDHFGGIAALREYAPDVVVAMHREDVPWVEDHDRYWRELFQRYDASAPPSAEDRESVRAQAGTPVVVDAILEPGDQISTPGASDLLVVDVHGSHSAGSLAYFNERSSILATGDVLQAAGTPFVDGTAAFPIYENIEAYVRTIADFRSLSPHTIVDAHRGVLQGGEVDDLLRACAAFPERLSSQLSEMLHDLGEPAGLVTIAHALRDRYYPDMNRSIQLYLTVDLHLQQLVREGVASTVLSPEGKRWRNRS